MLKHIEKQMVIFPLSVCFLLILIFFIAMDAYKIMNLKSELQNVQAEIAQLRLEIVRTQSGLEDTALSSSLSATEILAETHIIAHGMGTAGSRNEGDVPLNCLEGFLEQYEKD